MSRNIYFEGGCPQGMRKLGSCKAQMLQKNQASKVGYKGSRNSLRTLGVTIQGFRQ